MADFTHCPTNDVTELARERNRQAMERTLLSWINSALLLIGLGLSVGGVAPAIQQVVPTDASADLASSIVISLGAIALGIALLMTAAFVHRAEIKALERGTYLAQPLRRVNLWLVVASVALFGLVALVDIL